MISVWTWDCKNWLLYILQGRLWCPQMIKKCFCWSLTRDVQLQQINLDDTIQIQQKTILFHIKIIKEPRNHWWLQLPADQQPIATLGTPMVFLHSSFRRRDDLATESARRKRLGGKSCWVPRTCKLNYYLQRRYLSIQLQFVSLMSFYHQHDKVHVVLEELFILWYGQAFKQVAVNMLIFTQPQIATLHSQLPLESDCTQ